MKNLFVLIVLLSVCFSGGECRAQDNNTEVRIGLILSLSGSWADFGQAQQNALTLAKREHGEVFRNIQFIIEDCHYHPATAVAAFRKLVDRDHVNAVFVWGVEPALALAPLAERSRIPLFVSALDPKTV